MAKQSLLSQIPKTLAFRFRIPCQSVDPDWKPGTPLPEANRISTFGHLEQGPQFADIRIGWREDGLAVTVIVDGKQKSPWCRESQFLDSDGVQIWVDTRDTQNVHRATRFCHWFVLNPQGGGGDKSQPLANMVHINRAKEHSPTVNRQKIPVVATLQPGGYQLSAHLPAACLNGWNPAEFRNLGFYVAVLDRELGWHTLSVGPEMQFMEDPSLWATLALV